MNTPTVNAFNALALTTFACCLACAPSLAEDDSGMDGESGASDTGGDGDGDGVKIWTEGTSDGKNTVVDATSDAHWVYFDLDTQTQVSEGDTSWDLGFLRFHIKLNGGVSGDQGVEVAMIDDVDLADVSKAPDSGWVTDEPDGDDENMDPDYALRDWYEYDFMNHVLTPYQRVHVIRTSEDELVKLQLVDYYDEFGTSGYLSFDWAQL